MTVPLTPQLVPNLPVQISASYHILVCAASLSRVSGCDIRSADNFSLVTVWLRKMSARLRISTVARVSGFGRRSVASGLSDRRGADGTRPVGYEGDGVTSDRRQGCPSLTGETLARTQCLDGLLLLGAAVPARSSALAAGGPWKGQVAAEGTEAAFARIRREDVELSDSGRSSNKLTSP